MKQFLYTSLLLFFVTTQYHQANAQGWAEISKTLPEDTSASVFYGTSVAIDGDFAVVGAPTETINGFAGAGAAYVLQKKNTGWERIAKLIAYNGAANTFLGKSVALLENQIVVGGKNVVYVFEKSESDDWQDMTETVKLTTTDVTNSDDAFGDSVASSGNEIVVGAYGKENTKGAAYVFVRPLGGWGSSSITEEDAKLTASDEAGSNYNLLGFSVGISGDHIFVGASEAKGTSGAVYIFEKPASSGWSITNPSTNPITETTTLLNPLVGDSEGKFGTSLAISGSGNQIVVGAPRNYYEESHAGSAYVFVKPSGGWTSSITEHAKLNASDPENQDEFGYSVGISGDQVIVGLYNGRKDKAYLFKKPSTSNGWSITNPSTNPITETATLIPSDPLNANLFGRQSVGISGDQIIIGDSSNNDRANNNGAAYIFRALPVFENSTPSTSSVISTGFTLTADLDKAGKLYYVVVASGAQPPPTSVQVKDGKDGTNTNAIKHGNQLVNSGSFTHNFDVTGLIGNTTYDVYVVAENDDTPNLQTTTPTKITVTTDTGLNITGLTGVVTKGIVLSPNPVSEILSIQLSSGLIIKEVQVYDRVGREVTSLQGNLKNIDVNKFSAGIYFVKFITNQGVGVKKILKK